MIEYRVKWQQCPHVHHDMRLLFVEASSPDDAKVLARDHIERRHGIEWLTIWEVSEAKQLPPGSVKEGK